MARKHKTREKANDEKNDSPEADNPDVDESVPKIIREGLRICQQKYKNVSDNNDSIKKEDCLIQ